MKGAAVGQCAAALKMSFIGMTELPIIAAEPSTAGQRIDHHARYRKRLEAFVRIAIGINIFLAVGTAEELLYLWNLSNPPTKIGFTADPHWPGKRALTIAY